MKRWRGEPRETVPWFTAASASERRAADLFLADLLGRPAAARVLRSRVRAPEEHWAEGPDDPGRVPPVQAPVDRPAPTAPPALCARDVPITDRMALLVAAHAPLPVTCDELMRTVKDSGARADYKSVAAIVPGPTARQVRLFIFFHGNYGYVTLAPSGDVEKKVDPSGHSRVPRWLDDVGKAKARKFKSAPIEFEFETLVEAQRKIPWDPSFKGLVIKDPVVLVPEDAERNANTKSDHWSIPPPCQYGVEGDGTPTGPGTPRLEALVTECYSHLRCLTNPSGKTYLPAGGGAQTSWLKNDVERIYLSAHSGGGKPLLESAGADMVLVTPTSLAGLAGRAVDLWLFDATYDYGIENYVNFCANWNKAGLLGYGKTKTRVVCIYRGGTDTEATADKLRAELASKVLKVSKDSLLKVHKTTDMADASMKGDVLPALVSMPVVFVKTTVKHMNIPRLFAPLLLLTAAS